MNFITSEKTLIKIQEIIDNKKHGGYLRFGDGDVNLANGTSDMLQVTNEKLKDEMIEAFSINKSDVLKSLPLHCVEYGLDEGMYPGNHQCDKNWADNLLTRVKPFWGGEFQDIYSPVALHFLSSIYSTKAFDFLKFLKNKKPFALVGNQNIPSEIVNKLFGSECHHIKTPSENSFGEIDQVEFSLNNLYHNIKKDYYIIITSMGCSGRVLQKRIIKNYNNVFVFDFGSLMDALCGWNTRAWIELTKFDKDKFLNNL